MENSQEFIFSGHNTLDLARKYGTPLYVMSEDILRGQIEKLRRAFDKTGADYRIYYAGKSFLNVGLCYILKEEGLYLDTVSEGEIYTALSAGFDPEKIAFHGSNKTIEELTFAIDNGIGLIIVDSLSELKRLKKTAEEKEKRVKILIRVNPGVESHAHEFINTGKSDTKFGIPLEEVPEILETFDFGLIDLKGFHCHIGSQIYSSDPFFEAAQKVLKLYKKAERLGFELSELSLGGGFSVAYTKNEEDFRPEVYIPELIDRLKKLSDKLGIKLPVISIEPGRFISAPAGITLYTVGTIKELPGIRTYLSVDGGMMDNPRPALYSAEYESLICNRILTKENAKRVRISGRACENDTLIEEAELADPQEGDILAILKTGAYNYSMASNYNRLPKPAVVLLSQDRSDLLVERENLDDLVRKDKIPYWIK